MRIACLLAQGFEDSEFRVPYDRFRQAGHDVTVIGVKEGEVVRGDKGREEFETELAIADADPDDYDALFIPGGFSPDRLRADDRVVRFVRAFANRPIFAICHAPQLLLTADLVRGRTMTAWKTVRKELGFAGANVVDQEVVVDRNLVTSRSPSDLDAFVRESMGLLHEGTPAQA